jgi:hypothetical protein
VDEPGYSALRGLDVGKVDHGPKIREASDLA